MAECTHKWERIEYRDNLHRFIEVFWCSECGAIKKKIAYHGGYREEEIRLPKNQ